MYGATAPRVTLILLFKPCYYAKWNSVDQAQLLKGVLELAVLAVIARGETYGYEILSTLESAGFKVSVQNQDVQDPGLDGIVLSQNPTGGTKAPQGSTVTITVGHIIPPGQ